LNDSHEQKPPWVQVARILRPRGNKGEVLAELLTDFPQRLSSLKQFYLRKETEPPRAAELRRFWIDQNHPGMGVFHFADSTSISSAETLRGYQVLLPFDQRIVLPAGQYFVTDLIGCTVFDVPAQPARLSSPACGMEEAPRVLGTVADVFFTGEAVSGTPVLHVDTSQGELLVPLAEDICTRIDVLGKRIEVNLPEGLREIND
jgi:16S rRNA processing protein RimM